MIPAILALVALAACTPRTGGTAARPSAGTVGAPGSAAASAPVVETSEPVVPSASPATETIADGLVLTRRDILGAGWRPAAVPDGLGWSFALRGCAAYDAGDYPAQRHRSAARAAAFTQGHGRGVHVLLEGYADGWARQALTDIRRVLQACPRYDTGTVLTSHQVAVDGFTGDESLLVRSDHVAAGQPPREWWTAVIRHGDLVATVTGTELSMSEVRGIALAQSARLSAR
ncbi:MAG: hypothetical protein HOV79_33700 [Hamadaea sp.]|nr:hypothetical protein [Hamadaea sp.]